ncbi:HIT family protein [Xylanimonas sp. McL0601]|uniref:HIT family protein n=1 Tax=Xylanimonas sp. McL0601 TaxID=3414739 RepID=UPI003CEDD4AB
MTPTPPGQGDATVEPAAAFPPPNDDLQRLWTPHRMVYIGGQDKPKDASPSACPFCAIAPEDDERKLVVARGTTCYAILNLYPYNPGHLMLVPYRHVSAYVDLTDAETVELAQLTQTAIRVLEQVYRPGGYNLGMNQGDVAGAGIAAHLHQHVVPRWQGDSNFLPVVARTKAVPELLADARARLAAAWPAPTTSEDPREEPS